MLRTSHFLAAVAVAASVGAGTEAARAGDPPIQCGAILMTPGTVTLQADLGPCDTGDGIAAVILRDGVTLDMNGFQILCDDSNPMDGETAGGVSMEGSGGSLVNGTISGCAHGVTVHGAKNTVQNVSVEDVTGYGFAVNGSKNKFVDIHADDVRWGMALVGSGNKVEDCSIVVSEGGDDGVLIPGDKNSVSACTVTAETDGFDVDGEKNKVSDNTVSNSNRGITVGGANTKISGNTVTGSTAYGIVVDGPAKVLKNTVTGSSASGIIVEPMSDGAKAKVIKNSATGNGLSDGFDLEDETAGCGANVWKKNSFTTKNQDCIR